MIRLHFTGRVKLALTISFAICLAAFVIRFFYGFIATEVSSNLSSFIGWLAVIWVILSFIVYIILWIKESITKK